MKSKSGKKAAPQTSAEFNRFARFAKSLFAVPKEEVEAELAGRRARLRAKKAAGT
ncbi:hypothetical protein [Candidatus Binatus sp.]|uniref:hypothetical protein n=1 Tax=Candidatus Binatus sp. TaxID=2811406 RepID=UPI003F9A87D5